MCNTEPIKVLFISHSSAMTGAERSLLALLKYISKEHFKPVVILPSSGLLKDELEHLKITTNKIKCPWWIRGRRRNLFYSFFEFGYCISREILAIPRICKLIKKQQIDVVYTNSIVIFSGAISSLITRKPHIWHIREIITNNPDLHFFFSNKFLFRLISRLSSVVIANSKATASQFKLDVITRKIRVIYSSVDIEAFNVPTHFPNIDGVSTKDWIVAVVGSLQKRKGQDDAIRVIQTVVEKIPNIKLLLVGEGDKEFTNKLKQLVSGLNLEKEVFFTGYRPDVPQILPYCKALLVPSWNEPFGRTTIEAMDAGIPVIGTNTGGTREIIEDGVTGYLVPPNNPSIMAERMLEIYNSPALADFMGKNGKRLAVEKFSAQSCALRIEEAIMQAINDKF